MPRDDLKALGVKYRRIPVMSIGRDIYCDTRLILQKLERRFPTGALGATDPDRKVVEKLLEHWCMDTGVTARAMQLIPAEMPLLKDPKFMKDREELTGRSWSTGDIIKMRPEALVHTRNAFDFLETGLLADGREWILKTKKPMLADIETISPFHWLVGLGRALPPSSISAQHYPKVFSWIDRFTKAIADAKVAAPRPNTLQGPEAVQQIIRADFAEPAGRVEEDPLDLKKDQDVETWPIDSGSNHRDRGCLVGLNSEEVVVATRTAVEGREVRIHHPRSNFRIQAVANAKL